MVSLVFSLLSVAASVVILLDIKHIISEHMAILYITQIVVGAFALFSLCCVGVRTKKYHRDVAKTVERNLEESDGWFAGEEIKAEAAEDKDENLTTEEHDTESEE